jgi:hypothetical protein
MSGCTRSPRVYFKVHAQGEETLIGMRSATVFQRNHSLVIPLRLRITVLIFVVAALLGCQRVVTTGGPVDRKAALQLSQIALPLPDSAHDVYFLLVDYGTQNHDLFVRFSGDVNEIQGFVAKTFNMQHEVSRTSGKEPIGETLDESAAARSRRPWGTAKLPDWWHPEAMQGARYIGDNSKAPFDEHFWIDTNQGLVYYYSHF